MPSRGSQRVVKTAREEAARDAVEVIEVTKASLDHGEQMLAIARQKALRLVSFEGCELLRQRLPCFRLIIVRVRDEMDLDTLLVAAHWHAETKNQSRALRKPFDHREGAAVHQQVRI